MRKVCIVNNYNYERYLSFCINSLIKQSIKFDVIFVVDDGSSDNSRSIINKYAKSHQQIIPLFKVNAGQLSCFNYVSDYISEDDMVWCIDSDDYYPPDYVERFLVETKDSKSDFFFTKIFKFAHDELAPKSSFLEARPVVTIGLSSQITFLTRCWIGGPTSSIVISGRLLKDILPYPFENDWVTRADDVIIYASSLGEFSKTYIPSLCYGYRFHGNNYFLGRDINSHEYNKIRTKKIDSLFHWYSNKYKLQEKFKLKTILNEYHSASYQFWKKKNISRHRLVKKYLIKKIFYLLKNKTP